MAVAAITMGIIGGVSAIAGGISGKKAANKNAALATKMGEENAGILERQAEQGQKVMGYQLGQFDTGAGKFLGSQTAAVASSGIKMGGSAAYGRSDSIKNMRTDRTNLFDSYQNKIDELNLKAKYSRENGASQGDVLKSQGNANLWSGIGGGLSSFAGAFGVMAGM